MYALQGLGTNTIFLLKNGETVLRLSQCAEELYFEQRNREYSKINK